MKLKNVGNHVIIKSFPIFVLKNDINKRFSTNRVNRLFLDTGIVWWGKGTLEIHKFFIPELLYILKQLPPRVAYKETIELLETKTWYANTKKTFPNRVNTGLIEEHMNIQLKNYQMDFIKIYDAMKQKFMLNGYILALDMGLGKTATSLSLMTSLNKDCIIIVAPKSTLKTVWENEINRFFKDKQNIWMVGDKPKTAKFYIINYESLDKLSTLFQYINESGDNIGIIVDEAHNFRSVDAKRVKLLKGIHKDLNCQDILLMSGTPIKATGAEMIPTIQLLDDMFDLEAEQIFKRALGVNQAIALDILKERLGLIMHRKTKEEVIKLPKKFREEIKIKIPNGKKYTEEEVKKQIIEYADERYNYYMDNYDKYEKDFDECIDYVRPLLKNDHNFKHYLDIIKYFKTHPYQQSNPSDVGKAIWANQYEEGVIRPLLPINMRKQFDKSKSVIKYVNLKIMGEILGGLLNNLRAEMYAEMIKHSPIVDIIKRGEKKTICFSTYVDVVKNTEEFLKKNGLNPILIYGGNSSNVKQLLHKFRTEIDVNPLLATMQTLSTGVTVIEANQAIFLNPGWRHVDMAQSEDRLHRIGQDTDCYIYTFSLDTGEANNLSTRMDAIYNWSKEMFEGIVGKSEELDNYAALLKKKLI